jgi:hypothetical protein
MTEATTAAAGESSDGPFLDILSTAGTWVATALALIALVGIVGPWLALRAAHSESNRALNAIRDRDQVYVSHGVRIGPRVGGVAIFRRIDIPDFAPTYHANKYDVPRLAKHIQLGQVLRFKFPDHNHWNTGWAMLAATAERYTADQGEDGSSPLVSNRGGHWEVIHSLSAVVVSKYWILLLGLLGRYTEFTPPNQPQLLAGEGRFPARTVPARHPGTAGDGREDSDSGSVSDRSVPESSDSVASRGTRTGMDVNITAKMPSKFYLSQGKHGTMEITSSRRPSIFGFTGRFRSLGRQKGKWNYQSAVAFYGLGFEEANEMASSGLPNPQPPLAHPEMAIAEFDTLRVHFWLAHGFIPGPPEASYRKYQVYSILDPSSASAGSSKLANFLTKDGNARRRPRSEKFSLQGSGVSRDIILGATALNEHGGDANVWVQTSETEGPWYSAEPFDPLPDLIREQRGPNPPRAETQHRNIEMKTDDVAKAVQALLLLEWHEWGYLTPKLNCKYWTNIMAIPASLLSLGENSDFLDSPLLTDGLTTEHRELLSAVLDWVPFQDDPKKGYHPARVAELARFARMLRSHISTDMLWATRPLGALFITSPGYRASVYALLGQHNFPPRAHRPGEPAAPAPAPPEPATDAGGAPTPTAAAEPTTDEVPGAAAATLPTAPDDDTAPGPAAIPPADGPHHHLSDEWGRSSSSIEAPSGLEFSDEETTEQRGARERQNRRRTARRTALGTRQRLTGERGTCSDFSYTLSGDPIELTVSWTTRDACRGLIGGRVGLVLRGDDKQESDSVKMTTTPPQGRLTGPIADRDMAFIALWAAARCALWLSSGDSAALIRFVKELDRHVFVL